MKHKKMIDMTDDELRIIATAKTRKGIATERALSAQAELHDRLHWDEVDSRQWCEDYARNHMEDEE